MRSSRQVTLQYTESEGLFPGTLTTELKYSVLDNALHIEYTATTTATTPVSLTNHGTHPSPFSAAAFAADFAAAEARDPLTVQFVATAQPTSTSLAALIRRSQSTPFSCQRANNSILTTVRVCTALQMCSYFEFLCHRTCHHGHVPWNACQATACRPANQWKSKGQ
eukprot:SAG31_NODE_19931_length_588_cov_0.834356_1_plen_165_part_10